MPQGPIATGINALNTKTAVVGPTNQGAAGDLFVGQRHGPLYEAAYAKAMMLGANPSGVTLSAALATTYVGLCLSNPAASAVNLILQRAAGVLDVAPAALTAIGLIAGYAAGGVTVHTTPLTPLNAFLNGAAPAATLDSACTLVGTPAWVDWISETPAATTVLSFSKDYQGGIIIPPGGYVAIGATIAGPASGFWGSFTWEESPV